MRLQFIWILYVLLCSKVDLGKLLDTISVLERTRNSLFSSSSDEYSPTPLDKALTKQIGVRQAELDSRQSQTSAPRARTSTPDPEAEQCEENCLGQIYLDRTALDRLPAHHSDFETPLNNYFDSLQHSNPNCRPLISGSPRVGQETPVITRVGNPSSIVAPREPWSPGSARLSSAANLSTDFNSVPSIMVNEEPNV